MISRENSNEDSMYYVLRVLVCLRGQECAYVRIILCLRGQEC